MSQTLRLFQLDGKDYLDEQEAAHYMCVGITKFREIKEKFGVLPIDLVGKKLYRKMDLKRIIEDQAKCQHSTNAKAPRASHGH